MPSGSRLLDAPCGEGALTLRLLNHGYDVAGVDIDRAAAPWLAERFRCADLRAGFPWPDASFDLVLSVEGIEHLENPFAFLRELRRVLRPGGRLLLTTPNTLNLRSRVRFLGSGFYHRDALPLREDSPHPLHHIGLRTFPELRYALHTSGFQIEQIGHTHLKPVSLPYAVWVPWMWLYTRIAFRKEKDPAQRRHNRAIRKALFSRSLLFGENLMLLARRG